MGAGPGEVFESQIPQGFHPRLSSLVSEWVHPDRFGLVKPRYSRCALSAAFLRKHGPF